MKFDITQQESFSRSELLLRTFLGWLYITVPHTLVLFFVGIWSSILHFIAWWVIPVYRTLSGLLRIPPQDDRVEHAPQCLYVEPD